MASARVYKLAPNLVGEGAAKPLPRLVEATSQSQAYGHVARMTWTASVATQNDLLDLAVKQKIEVEKASAE